MQRIKVIFLDIDGVLNSKRTPNPKDLPYIVDKRRVRLFKKLVARTRAKVVLVSDWRHDPAGLFAARFHGVRYQDVTPEHPKSPRGDQIRAWLRKHPNVSRYVVIDDDDDELDDLPLFQPSDSTGLTARLVQGIEKYLAGKTDKDMRSGPIVRTLENAREKLKRFTK